MTTTDWIWIAAGIIVGALILGGLVLWVLSYLAREQRRIQAQRRPEYESPRSTSGFGIRWGDEARTSTEISDPNRIQWGTEQEAEPEWVPVSPINYADDTDVDGIKCPICKHVVDESSDESFKCPGCRSLYHQDCWEYIEHKCVICPQEGT